MFKTIYISLPVSGYNISERYNRAEKIKERLLADGWAVMSPIGKSGVPDDAPREVHMRDDLKLLLKCDAIYLDNGWSEAAGCILEFNVALQCGMEIINGENEDG